MNSLPCRRVNTSEEIVKPGDWCIADELVFASGNTVKHGHRVLLMRCPHCMADNAFNLTDTRNIFQRARDFFLPSRLNTGPLACYQNALHVYQFKNGDIEAVSV